MRYDPLDYLYASARIRAIESRFFLGREKINQLLAMPHVSDVERELKQWGFTGQDEYGVRSALEAAAESVPDSSLLLFLQYPYDAHNLKVLEKCRIKDAHPQELLIDLGSVPAKSMLTVSEKQLFLLLPDHLAQGLTQAREVYARTGDPREIDLILDRAVYADMQQAAAPYPFAAEYVRVKADLVNLQMCLRLLRMREGELGRALLLHAVLCVGSFDQEFLLACFDGGEEEFYKQVAHTPYGEVFVRGESLADTERRADNYLMALLRRARHMTFGAEVAIAFVLAAEQQSKNLRILLAGKEAALDAQVIQARMRESYV